MTVLVVNHPDDDEVARNVVGALVESDVDTFWAKDASGVDAARLETARAVLYLHSAAGAKRKPRSPLTRAIATAHVKDLLILARIDSAPVEDALSDVTTYDLRGRRQRRSSLFMLDLVAAVRAKAAGLDPPLQRAPRQLLLRRLLLAAPAIIGAIALAVGFYRDVGLDRRAGSAERAVWENRAAGSCDDLRSYLGAYPDGAYAFEAQSLLAGATTRRVERPERREDRLVLFETAQAHTEDGARQQLGERLSARAEKSCRQLASNGGTRFLSAAVESEEPRCEASQGLQFCAVDASAVCALQETRMVATERCE